MSPALRDLAELVRLPAAVTVPGDTLVGLAAGGGPAAPRAWLLPASSLCLYWAGMALNDWGDRELDALERPERPVPSGRVRPEEALALAGGLTAAGVAVAGLAGGRRAVGVAGLLAAAVWTYDLAGKRGPLAPVSMSLTRALDVLLGATASRGGTARGLVPALVVGVHTLGVTDLSRDEVHGSSGSAPVRAQAATASATVGALAAAAVTAAGAPGRDARGVPPVVPAL
ncbi:SCO3242 family prenyltransferase, partial [Aquipuribacter sp. SD81]|uniref:SCO3242 family prenyltransferase n=1 Tax=Aquipuribacter sp. SD81 TaxID=3127703 RepID=UPI00301B57C0